MRAYRFLSTLNHDHTWLRGSTNHPYFSRDNSRMDDSRSQFRSDTSAFIRECRHERERQERLAARGSRILPALNP